MSTPEAADRPKEAGFEYEGEFIPWHLTDKIKDLQMIDYFAKMPPGEFFEHVRDDFDRSRTPITAAMIATSLLHARPNWSTNRVIRVVENMESSRIVYFDGEDEPSIEVESPLATDPASGDGEDSPESSERLSEPAVTPSET